MQKRKTLSICMIVLCLSSILFGCTRRKEPISQSGFYFNTVISVTLYDDAYSKQLKECFALADKYETYFSTTIQDSDIYKINHSDGKPVEVHNETIELIQKGLEYSKLSNGGFDITIGALSSLWNFSENDGTIPDDIAIKDAIATVNYENISIENHSVTLTNPDTQIDLGAIAKGYIADKMKSYLNEQGITSGIINLGGNVLCVGPKENGDAYHIGIQKPFAEEGTSILAIDVHNQTVVSSGIYERYFKVNDKIYHHLLNPKTGYPYDNGLIGVTIICDNSVDGDGLSTTCFSLGLEDGMKLIESLDHTEAIFITEGNELHYSSGMGKDIEYEKVAE